MGDYCVWFTDWGYHFCKVRGYETYYPYYQTVQYACPHYLRTVILADSTDIYQQRYLYYQAIYISIILPRKSCRNACLRATLAESCAMFAVHTRPIRYLAWKTSRTRLTSARPGISKISAYYALYCAQVSLKMSRVPLLYILCFICFSAWCVIAPSWRYASASQP